MTHQPGCVTEYIKMVTGTLIRTVSSIINKPLKKEKTANKCVHVKLKVNKVTAQKQPTPANLLLIKLIFEELK